MIEIISSFLRLAGILSVEQMMIEYGMARDAAKNNVYGKSDCSNQPVGWFINEECPPSMGTGSQDV